MKTKLNKNEEELLEYIFEYFCWMHRAKKIGKEAKLLLTKLK